MADAQAADAPAAAGKPGHLSRWIDLDGPVHYLDFGGPGGAPVIVCVHGLGGSAVNWSAIAPLLAGSYRLLAPDLAGHGLTRSAGRGTDVQDNQVLLHRFLQFAAVQSAPGSAARKVQAAGRLWRSARSGRAHPVSPESGPRPVILMGNSMGGMISLLEAEAAPDGVAGLILVDPALPFVPARPDPFVAAMFALYATPGLGGLMMSRRRDMTPEESVASLLSLCCADPSRVPADVLAQHVEVARQRAAFPEGARDVNAAMRSVARTVGAARGQAYRRAVGSVSCPVLLLHGERDRLVPRAVAAAAARAHPSWTLVLLPGVGHVPQLEAPADTASAITDWLGSAGRDAADSARPSLFGGR